MSSALAGIPPSDDVYEPRRSARVNADLQADGDTWHEKLLVCESSPQKLVIRSYFKNSRTGKKVWDEPPSGASRIEPAMAKERREAEEQLQILQAAVATNAPSAAAGKKASKGFLRSFLKKSKDKKPSSSPSGGSKFFGKKNTVKTKQNTDTSPESTEDSDIQKAISLSMGLSLGEDFPMADSSAHGNWQDDLEALEIAKAISMSEAESKRSTTGFPNIQSEDEMLQRALEESRLQASGVAAMPQPGIPEECNLLGLSLEQREPLEENRDVMFLDKKMPAKPSANATAKPLGMFDPYGKDSTMPSAIGRIPERSGADASSVLRKMDVDDSRRMPGAAIGRRIFSKKSVEEEAGVV